jgi:two-component system, chemotaxis family, protein-glutamate methylesterase/glutaminase
MKPIRVLVAEDSPTARALLVEILASDPAIVVVGEARNGREAVEMSARLRPDLITMDIEMPVMDGLEATKQIMVRAPAPIVVVTGSVVGREPALSLDATEAGALSLVSKPGTPGSASFDEQCRQLLATVKAMAQVKVVRRWERARVRATPVPGLETLTKPTYARVVAIGASTGGPAALHEIFRHLPASFASPILVVQHIASGFVEAFASWLDGGCKLRVKVAQDGEPLRGGTVYVAPEDRQLGVNQDHGIALSADPSQDGFRPSASYLFESVARRYGSEVIAVILTGMGGDGVAGLRQVYAGGGQVFAQDEESCIVYGMPREAVRAGVVTAVLSPRSIAERLIIHVKRERDADESAHR